MTYNEIIQKPGKQIEKQVYYYDDNNEIQAISNEDFVQAKISFNSDLVGSVMKGLELQLKVTLPSKPIYLNVIAKYGSSTATKLYGPYNIKDEPEYSADEKKYTYKLYDQFLNTMVDYQPITITYPCTVIGFFLQLVSELGLTTNITELSNGLREISSDIYDGINFTYRDVFDDIGKATATLFEIDGTEVKKCTLGTSTNQATIDDDILKNCNINFGQHYGPINTIILSRSADSDYIYLSEQGTSEEDRIAFKIEDCQLMNDNNRNDYLSELLTALSGIEYDIFDTELVGYGGFTPLQKVSFETGDETYSSYVFNNEIIFTSGYTENIYTDMPDESEPNYKASDTTDKRINQAFILVDKQNQTINALTSNVQSISDNVSNNIYTKEQSNELVQNATNGLTNTFKSIGGNNFWRNTFFSEKENNSLTFWNGNLENTTEQDSASKTAGLLPDGVVYQTISIPNGTYTNKFKYKKLISTASCTVRYNNRVIELTGDVDEEEVIETTEEISTGSLTIEFECDTANGFEFYELMVNQGTEASVFTQNQSESISDTVNIGKGIQVENSAINSFTRLDADGLRGYNKQTNENTFYQTDDGIYGKKLKTESIQSGNLIVSTRGKHNFMSGI